MLILCHLVLVGSLVLSCWAAPTTFHGVKLSGRYQGVPTDETNSTAVSSRTQHRQYQVSFLRSEATRPGEKYISANYLSGYFAQELDTDVKDALVEYGPDFEPPYGLWRTEIQDAFGFVKMTVNIRPSLGLDVQRPFDLALIRDIHEQVAYWILNRDDWDDGFFDWINVIVLDELPIGSLAQSAQVAISSHCNVGTWTQSEKILLRPSPFQPSQKGPQNLAGIGNVTALSRRASASKTTSPDSTDIGSP